MPLTFHEEHFITKSAATAAEAAASKTTAATAAKSTTAAATATAASRSCHMRYLLVFSYYITPFPRFQPFHFPEKPEHIA